MKGRFANAIPFFVVLLSFFLACDRETEIPDEPVRDFERRFFTVLTHNGVDSNGDGIISQSEAEATLHLDLYDRGLTDVSGIDAFINLETLDCSFNTLTELDLLKLSELSSLNCKASHLNSLNVSGCTKLKYLNCSQNTIQHLYLENHPLLEELYCSNNYDLEELNITLCSALRVLECAVNDLVELDISACTSLEHLACYINDLASLDVSTNLKLVFLQIYAMPTLVEVCVWSLPFPPSDVNVDTAGSPNVIFMDCS